MVAAGKKWLPWTLAVSLNSVSRQIIKFKENIIFLKLIEVVIPDGNVVVAIIENGALVAVVFSMLVWIVAFFGTTVESRALVEDAIFWRGDSLDATALIVEGKILVVDNIEEDVMVEMIDGDLLNADEILVEIEAFDKVLAEIKVLDEEGLFNEVVVPIGEAKAKR